MSDVRGLPKGSKALTVVVIVVFLQVLVVAVFGLNAMLGDRAEAEQKALQLADAKAGATLDRLVRAVRQVVATQIESAATKTDAEGLQALARESPERLVREIYQVDPKTREIWWIDGEHRLYVPAEVRQREAAEQQAKADDDRQVAAKEMSQPSDFVREYPYVVRRGGGYPRAIGAARRMLEQLDEQESLSEGKIGPLYEKRRQRVLAALEVASLHRAIPEMSALNRLHVDALEKTVDSVVVGAPFDRSASGDDPDRAQKAAEEAARLADALRLEVLEFRRAREMLESQGFLEAVMSALPDAVGGEPSSADSATAVVRSGKHLIGITTSPRQGRYAVARLNLPGIKRTVEDHVDASALAELGVEIALLDDDAPGDPAVSTSRSFAQRPISLPLRADLRRVRPPAMAGFGPSAWFYWGIIAGAVGGLALGGYILVRTLRREMRVARLKADFVGNLSHELKTPLTSIAMFTEMLREGKLSTPVDREEAYDVLTQESNRLQRIVGRMIDTARREIHAEPYALVAEDLNRPVRDAVLRMRRIVTEPGLDLVLEPAGGPLPVLLDVSAIDDAVTNLLSNAWKYRDGDRARIVVRTARLWRKAELTVADDGIGIPRRERRKVFEMFYRAEQFLTRAVPGTGLGLALVRTIVRSHHGTVRIEAGEGGKGTLFRLRFPLTRTPLPTAAPEPRASDPRGSGILAGSGSGATASTSAPSEAKA